MRQEERETYYNSKEITVSFRKYGFPAWVSTHAGKFFPLLPSAEYGVIITLYEIVWHNNNIYRIKWYMLRAHWKGDGYEIKKTDSSVVGTGDGDITVYSCFGGQEVRCGE